jgi:hypothetical protein
MGERVRGSVWRFLFDLAARRSAIDYLDRNIYRYAKKAAHNMDLTRREAVRVARYYMRSIKDTSADLHSAYQSILHVPREVDRAIGGPGGLRIRATGEGATYSSPEFQKTVGDKLRDMGLDFPRSVGKHGSWIDLHHEPLGANMRRIGRKNLAEFENYAHAKVRLARWKAKKLVYP